MTIVVYYICIRIRLLISKRVYSNNFITSTNKLYDMRKQNLSLKTNAICFIFDNHLKIP